MGTAVGLVLTDLLIKLDTTDHFIFGLPKTLVCNTLGHNLLDSHTSVQEQKIKINGNFSATFHLPMGFHRAIYKTSLG